MMDEELVIGEEWTVQHQKVSGFWSETIPSNGPEVFNILGKLHPNIRQMEVVFQDGSKFLYKKVKK
jgi:hypothetical protein